MRQLLKKESTAISLFHESEHMMGRLWTAVKLYVHYFPLFMCLQIFVIWISFAHHHLAEMVPIAQVHTLAEEIGKKQENTIDLGVEGSRYFQFSLSRDNIDFSLAPGMTWKRLIKDVFFFNIPMEILFVFLHAVAVMAMASMSFHALEYRGKITLEILHEFFIKAIFGAWKHTINAIKMFIWIVGGVLFWRIPYVAFWPYITVHRRPRDAQHKIEIGKEIAKGRYWHIILNVMFITFLSGMIKSALHFPYVMELLVSPFVVIYLNIVYMDYNGVKYQA